MNIKWRATVKVFLSFSVLQLEEQWLSRWHWWSQVETPSTWLLDGLRLGLDEPAWSSCRPLNVPTVRRIKEVSTRKVNEKCNSSTAVRAISNNWVSTAEDKFGFVLFSNLNKWWSESVLLPGGAESTQHSPPTAPQLDAVQLQWDRQVLACCSRLMSPSPLSPHLWAPVS